MVGLEGSGIDCRPQHGWAGMVQWGRSEYQAASPLVLSEQEPHWMAEFWATL